MIYARVSPRDIFPAVFSFPYFAAPSTAVLELKSNSCGKYAPRWLLIIKIARARVYLNSSRSLHCRAFSDGTCINRTERHDEMLYLIELVAKLVGEVTSLPVRELRALKVFQTASLIKEVEPHREVPSVFKGINYSGQFHMCDKKRRLSIKINANLWWRSPPPCIHKLEFIRRLDLMKLEQKRLQLEITVDFMNEEHRTGSRGISTPGKFFVRFYMRPSRWVRENYSQVSKVTKCLSYQFISRKGLS